MTGPLWRARDSAVFEERERETFLDFHDFHNLDLRAIVERSREGTGGQACEVRSSFFNRGRRRGKEQKRA